MSTIESQITSVSIVHATVCSGADQRKHQSSVSLAFVRARKMFPFDDVIMLSVNPNDPRLWHCLHAQNLPSINAVRGDSQWPLQSGRNFHRSRRPKVQCDTRQSKPSSSQLEAMSPSYSTESPAPANTQRNKHVIITSKRRFGVIITCLLRCVFSGTVASLWLCRSPTTSPYVRLLWFIYRTLCSGDHVTSQRSKQLTNVCFRNKNLLHTLRS